MTLPRPKLAGNDRSGPWTVTGAPAPSSTTVQGQHLEGDA